MQQTLEKKMVKLSIYPNCYLWLVTPPPPPKKKKFVCSKGDAKNDYCYFQNQTVTKNMCQIGCKISQGLHKILIGLSYHNLLICTIGILDWKINLKSIKAHFRKEYSTQMLKAPPLNGAVEKYERFFLGTFQELIYLSFL